METAVSKWGINVNDQDHLVWGNQDTVELAKLFGTPLHIVDKSILTENYHSFLKHFSDLYPESVEIMYSYKTNPVPGVLRVMHDEGAGAEVISPVEFRMAMENKVPGQKVILNGPCKKPQDLKAAIESGVKIIFSDSISEIEKIVELCADMKKRANIGIRVNPDVVPKGSTINAATGSRKGAVFGLDLKSGEALKGAKIVQKSDWVNFRGFHCHIGTGLRDSSGYITAVARMTEFMSKVHNELGLETEYLDLGGGVGIANSKEFSTFEFLLYQARGKMPSPPDPGEFIGIRKLSEDIIGALMDSCRRKGLNLPKLIFEPGRAITGSAQILLLTVYVVKNRPGVGVWAVTDGGPARISFPTVYEYHEIFCANRASAPRSVITTVTGDVCASFDVLYRRKKIPMLQEGDFLAVMDTGAYFVPFESDFSFGRSAIVIVDQNGPRLIRRHGTYEDIISRDLSLNDNFQKDR